MVTLLLFPGTHCRKRYKGLELISSKENDHFFCSQKDFTFSTGKALETYQHNWLKLTPWHQIMPTSPAVDRKICLAVQLTL